MVLKVRNFNTATEKPVAWRYFSTTKLDVQDIEIGAARAMAFPDGDSVAYPYDVEWCIGDKSDTKIVSLIHFYPKHDKGCGLVFAELGAAFLLNEEGKTIEKI